MPDKQTRELLYLADPVRRVNETFGLGYQLDETQASIVKDRSPRIIVNCSRQWGKTSTVAAKAAAEALYGPGLILVVAPVERQARELLRKIRDCLRKSDKEPWPEDNKLSLELPNGARIVALPAKGENIRGYTNPKIVIIDEAAFVADEDYRAIRPMLSHGARLIIMSTPFGKRGFFYDLWKGQSHGWHRYQVLAEDCGHIAKEFLAEERAALGPSWYSQEYECAFIDSVAGLFDMEAVREALEAGVDVLEGFNPDGTPNYIDMAIAPLEVT